MEKKNNKETSVFIRFKKEEKELLRELADEQGLTLSAYARQMILTTLKERGISTSDKKETKKRIYGF